VKKEIKLNNEEAAWLSKNIKNTLYLLELQGEKDPEVLKRKNYLFLKSILPAALDIDKALSTELPDGVEADIILSLSQGEKNRLTRMTESTLAVLETTILPKYKELGLENYAGETLRKVSMLKALMRKLR